MTGKTIKKVISMILMLAMLGTAVAVFSGCGLFTKKVVGTEAAKILLARERLDEDLIGQRLNIFPDTAPEENNPLTSGGFLSGIFPWMNVNASLVGLRAPVLAALAPGATFNSGKVTWDRFEDASSMIVAYAQFIEPIDDSAAETAERIATIKENVGITEKWINFGSSDFMLIVDESSETIIEYEHTYDSVYVSTRYTTDDAKCIYEMYSYMKYDDGTTATLREKCIPGEFYEYTCRNSSGFNDYFIADNSRGYWLMNRFYFNDQSCYFDMSSVRDDVGYGISVSSQYGEGGALVAADYNDVDLFSPNDHRDLMSISELYDSYEISLYMSNLNGITSLSAGSDAYQYEKEYGHVGEVYLSSTEYGLASNIVVNLKNGGQLKKGDGTDKVQYLGSHVDYNLFFGTETYTGRLIFNVTAETEDEALRLLTDYISSKGISMRTDLAKIDESYDHAQLLYENYDVMQWYGRRMNTYQNLVDSEKDLIKDSDKHYAIYEKVKNNETVSGSYNVKRSLNFAELNVLSKGSASYADGIIRIDGLNASTEASEIFESGKNYALKVGLARLDENGEYRSANTVTLFSEAEEGDASVAYSGKDMSFKMSGSFSLPTALSEGEYMVVVYYATADEGIRVSEMAPIAFFSAEEGTLNSEFMSVSVKKSGENLLVKYEVSLTDTVASDYSKSSYTYEDIERILLRGVLAKGYPVSGAVVQNDKGEALSESGSYGAGTYRLKYLVNTSAGLVEAYMYTTLDTTTLN